MVKLRLTRFGRHKLPFYRIVAVDSKAKANGDYIELLGTYDPIKGKVDLKKEAIIKQLNFGAQPSDTVKSILRNEGVWASFKASKQQNKAKK